MTQNRLRGKREPDAVGNRARQEREVAPSTLYRGLMPTERPVGRLQAGRRSGAALERLDRRSCGRFTAQRFPRPLSKPFCHVSLCPWRIGAIIAAALVLLHTEHDHTT